MDKLIKSLDELSKKAKNAGGNVSFDELFNSSFMVKHTQVSTIDEFFEQGGFKIKTEEDLKGIPDAEIDAHVVNTTSFQTWEQMLKSAATEHVKKQLGF